MNTTNQANDIYPHLEEIANRLWSNNASVMVGAGFSLNACPAGSLSASFPSWKELGDIFFNKLHGRSPGQESRYLSLLKLAEQVQASFGRPVLDRLLLNEIPDLAFDPSPLHSELLKLPWQDIFTTNYDTLLERARASVTLKHYNVVIRKEDLLYARKPRIVKLHGSFPSPPFVITEEDYRRYPIDHAPFVNTVRQSLLENTLCLIGFSGDDPNFLQWVGWVRDHVGKEVAPKIYLIGVFNTLSYSEKMLLDGRGIVVIDLSVFSTDQGQALGKFLGYLKNRKARAPAWPTDSKNLQVSIRDDGLKKYDEIVAQWSRQRDEYPGWVVVPEDRRKELWRHTEKWAEYLSRMSSQKRAEFGTPLDLNLAFELSWRLDRCLFPLHGELPAFLEEVVAKYSDTMPSLPEEAGWTGESLLEAISNIRLWLLRHYREEGLDDNWKATRQAIEQDLQNLLPEHIARFRYEEVLQALFHFDHSEAKQLLTNWQANENLPFWEAKRAALMAELGEAAAAHPILEASLSSIRQQLNLVPIIEDYTLVSQESVVMLLLLAVERGINFRNLTKEDKNFMNELSERWDELVRYKCDPRREIASLSAQFGYPSTSSTTETTSHEFDLGSITKTIHFGTKEDVVSAYGLLRLYEDIGIPYRIENMVCVSNEIKYALPRIHSYSPHWALVNFVRFADVKVADGLFDREYLAGLGQDEADNFTNIYLPSFEHIISIIEKRPDGTEAQAFERLVKTLLEVFSRLCYKCSPACRKRMLSALGTIYSLKWIPVLENISRFAKRLFDSMSVKERIDAVPILIDIPVPERLYGLDQATFSNPIQHVHIPASESPQVFNVTEERINQLLDIITGTEKDRDWAAMSLIWLHIKGQISGQQSTRLGKLLWNDVEESGIPSVAGYYSVVWIDLPHPDSIDPESRVKKHIRSIIRSQIRNNSLNEGMYELRASVGTVNWSEGEVVELFGELMKWWEENKNRLLSQNKISFELIDETIEYTASNIIHTLSMLISHLSERNEIDSLNAFINDLSSHGIPKLELEAATLPIMSGSEKQVVEKISAAMLHHDDDTVRDSLSAIRILALAWSEEKLRNKFTPLATMLIEGIQWRHRPGLKYRLRIVADLIENQPWFLSTETLNGLLSGLGEILKETESGVSGNDRDGVIGIRASGASLAFALSKHHLISQVDMPETIRRWREVCSNPNEFAEVRNSWLDL